MTKDKKRTDKTLANATYAELRTEIGRRHSAMRKTFGAGSGRPRVMKPCATCGESFSGREMRKHKCPNKGATNDQV